MMREPGARPGDRGGGLRLARWYAASATLNIPQAAGPVAFSLVALGLTGDPGGGAAIMVAMTLAQVLGAVPLTRLGASLPTATMLRWLVGLRTLALVGLAVLAARGAAVPWLVGVAALAGSVNGAAFGQLRALLNALTPEGRLPRALGIAATLNEVAFVLAPVLASGLGAVSPVLAVLVPALLGAVPALVVPGSDRGEPPPRAAGPVLSRPVLLWLGCAAASGAAVAAVEIGAVALALHFGYRPALAILFTVPLCLASVAGGVWVSVRNRAAAPRTVALQLAAMALGSALVAAQLSAAATVVGAVVVGAVLAPLATHYSLALDRLAPPDRRAEAFALLRTANAAGLILAGLALTLCPLTVALRAVATLMAAAALTVALASAFPSAPPRPRLTRTADPEAP